MKFMKLTIFCKTFGFIRFSEIFISWLEGSKNISHVLIANAILIRGIFFLPDHILLMIWFINEPPDSPLLKSSVKHLLTVGFFFHC
jgi:hypothetical protein